MITTLKIKQLLAKLAGVKQKNGFQKSWRTELKTIGGSTNDKWLFLKKIDDVLRKIPFPTKRAGFISRSEKRKKYSLKALKVLSISLLMVVLLAAAHKPLINIATSLDFFMIKSVEIAGCEITETDQIKEIAGLNYNTSLIAIRPGQTEAKLLANPWIRSARVERMWPDGVKITLKEHEAAAIVIEGGHGNEKMVYINAQGALIAEVNVGDDIDYPVITGLNETVAEGRGHALKEAAQFLKYAAINNPNLPAQSVSDIHFDLREGMVIRLVDFPFPIYFGRGDVQKKYKQLRNVLAVLYKKQKKNIDISQVEYIRMDYLNNKVLVAQSKSG